MTKSTLRRLNRILGDRLGFAPSQYGVKPRYAWHWAPELLFPVPLERRPVRSAGGIWTFKMEYALVHQLDEPRWVVALWREPPSPSEWRRLHSDDLPYPGNGTYYLTSEMLKEHVEPDEEITNFIAAKIIDHNGKTRSELIDEIDRMGAAKEKEIDTLTDDLIAESQSGYGYHIPGVKSSDTSFGGGTDFNSV